MRADYLIRNGRLLDPGKGLDEIGDLAVKDGVITALGRCLEIEPERVLNAEGLVVTAGAIDIHTHIYETGVWNGMPADLAAIPMGVTAVVDAGSAGVSNYQGLLRLCERGRIRSKIMLNVSACGIIMPAQFSEPVDPALWDLKLFDMAFQRFGGQIIGLKLRISREVVKELGLEPLKKAVKLAERYGTCVIAHVTDAPEPMSAVADCMRAGDVFCHVYHGTGYTILDGNGRVEQGVLEAQKRGVIFDAAPGRGNFSLDIARKAIQQGFLPDIISTDATLQSWHNPIAGQLPLVMSKFLALGLSVKDIVTRVTEAPAHQFGVGGLGTLNVGTPADISVFKLVEKEKRFADKFGNSVVGDRIFLPVGTMIAGQLLYRGAEFDIEFP